MQKWVAGEVLPTVRKTGGAYQNLTAPVSEIYLAIFTPPPMSSQGSFDSSPFFILGQSSIAKYPTCQQGGSSTFTSATHSGPS